MENTEEMTNIKEQQQDIECSEEQKTETNTAEEAEETPTPVHPYQDELSQFQPHTWQLEEKEPQTYSSLDETKFTMVDSQPLLNEMMVKLKEVRELAIAMEHNSYRSFHGMVCLLQISTRTEDFLIDPLMMKEDLDVLNEVCTDSNILKVMHGSGYRNIKLLQKDFGIYVINMFDTQTAAKVLKEDGAPFLGSQGESLSKILKKYCDIVVNKEHERPDWRVRPLPDRIVKYAREEAHFLLYIHDVFRNSLVKKKALEDVYKTCTDSCGYVWHPDKHTFRPDSYMACYKAIQRNTGKLNVQQLECFRLLYEWRHNISKENDEGTGYTLPNKMMIKISKALPKEAQGIVKCCNPVPPFVEQNLELVHKLVLQAIINVPQVPQDPVKNAQLLAIKNSKKKKMNQLRGGAAWNRGRGAPFGAYPPRGPWMRGGPGFRGRGPRPMGPMHMYPYGHPHPHHPYDGMDGYHAGPYNGPFNPYNQHGAHPHFNAGGWW